MIEQQYIPQTQKSNKTQNSQMMLPTLQKRPKLKPLTLSDILVSLINQQHKPNQLAEYKKLLGDRWATNQQNREEKEYTIEEVTQMLPQFARNQYSYQEIFDYHVKNKLFEVSKYEELLAIVDKKFTHSLYEYTDKLKEGQQAMENLIDSLAQAHSKILTYREQVNTSKKKINEGYKKIGPILRKISNLGKVLDIMGIWGELKISYLLSIDLLYPQRYDITDILQLFQHAIKKITHTLSTMPHSQKSSTSIQTMLSSLTEKHQRLIKKVSQNFTASIMTFTTTEQYRIRYQQYVAIRDQGLCPDVFTEDGIKGLVEANGKAMFYGVLVKLTPNMNVDLLNQTIYLEFYQQVIEQFVTYFRNWHYITTFHIDSQTPYPSLFLTNRKQVFLILSHRLTASIESSKRFITLEYKVKLQLIEKLQDYIEAGEKWMGNCEGLDLMGAVTRRLSDQLGNIFGLYNNLIKNVLTQEISVGALEKVDQLHPFRNVKIINEISQINYQKITKFLCYSNPHKNYIVSSNSQHNPSQNNSQPIQPPQVRLQIGSTFTQMISEYLQRSRYLQSNKSIYLQKILQHFQFIIFMMYQVCLRQNLKQQLSIPIASKLSQLQQQFSNKNQQLTPKSLNELTKIHTLRRRYSQILEFIQGCGNKYDGIKIAGIIDVNKVFDSGNAEIIGGYIKLIVRVVADLKAVGDWLLAVVNRYHPGFKVYKEYSKIAKLSAILKELFGLILENNMDIIHKKYIDNVSPILQKLKWQIKKFNQQQAMQYKQYKLKVLQTFRNSTLQPLLKSQLPQLLDLVQDRQIQALYRALLQCYGKIDKINDNGRQVIRMDCVEVTKLLTEIGVKVGGWGDWFDRYLDFMAERQYKVVIEKIANIASLYDPVSWRYHLIWVVCDLSTREKKEYNTGLVRIYVDYLSEAR